MKHRIGIIIRGVYEVNQTDLWRLYRTTNIHTAIQKELDEYNEVVKDEVEDGFLFGVDDVRIELLYEGIVNEEKD